MANQTTYLEALLPDPNGTNKALRAAEGIENIAKALGKVYTLDVTALTSPYTLPYSALEGGDKTALHFIVLQVTGTPAGAFTIIIPNKDHFFVLNNLSSQSVIVKTLAGTGPTAASSASTYCYCDATNVVGFSGAQGVSSGQLFKFDTAITDVDPGAGFLRANNAAMASATFLYVDEADIAGADITAWENLLDDSTSNTKGYLRLTKIADQTVWHEYAITGAVVAGAGYKKVPVSYVSGVGAFATNDKLSVSFTATGDKGTIGSTGVAGTVPNTISYVYSTTTADADPGSGIFRLNNATMASVTAGYFDNNEQGGASVAGWLDTFDDATATVKGALVLRDLTTPAAFAVFHVTGSVVDGTGYRKLTLTHLASGGTFADTDAVCVSFHRSGDAGSSLDLLSDVVITAPAAGDVLKYNGSEFVNSPSAVIAPAPNYADSTVYLAPLYTAPTIGAIAANRLYLVPVQVRLTRTFTQMAFRVTTAGVAGKIALLGIYNVDADGQPTTLVAQGSASVSVASTGLKTVAFSQSIAPGNYLLAFWCDGTPSIVVFTSGLFGGTIITASAVSTPSAIYRDVASLTSLTSDETANTFTILTTNAPVAGIR